jgi:hypothetical protein
MKNVLKKFESQKLSFEKLKDVKGGVEPQKVYGCFDSEGHLKFMSTPQEYTGGWYGPNPQAESFCTGLGFAGGATFLVNIQ